MVGRTSDGWTVVRGVFEWFDTYGVPLDMVLDELRIRQVLPDWVYLYERCLKAGWNPKSTWERLRTLVGDVYGPDYRVEWERRMKEHGDEHG